MSVKLAPMRRCPSCGMLTYSPACPDCGVETYVGVPVGRMPDVEWYSFKPGESPNDEDDEVWAVTDRAKARAAEHSDPLNPDAFDPDDEPSLSPDDEGWWSTD